MIFQIPRESSGVRAGLNVRPFGEHEADGDRWQRYNYDELREAPHASLAAVMPGATFEIGASRQIRAETSGPCFCS